MGVISVSLPSDGTVADVSDYNNPITTIVNEFNGNIDNSNLSATAAVAGSKLADEGITTPKLADDSVTPEKRSGGFYAVVHDFGSGTGSASVTGVPFQPKMILVISTNETSAVNFGMWSGYAVDGSPIVQGFAGGQAASGDRATGNSSTQAFVRYNAAQTTGFAATVTSFNADGITVNKTTGTGTANMRTFHIVFFG